MSGICMIRICIFLYRTCGLPTLEAVTACQVRVAALCSGPTPSLSTRLHKPCSCSSSKVVYVQASSCMHFSLIYAYGGICTHLQSITDLVCAKMYLKLPVLPHLIFCLHFTTPLLPSCCLINGIEIIWKWQI